MKGLIVSNGMPFTPDFINFCVLFQKLLGQESDVLYIMSQPFHRERNKNSVALICELTILTEEPPLVSEVSANFCA
jgi:hypothetical protein